MRPLPPLRKELNRWLGLTLLAPLLALLYLTFQTMQIRLELARDTASEAQQEWLLKAEEFYLQRFLPAYQNALVEQLEVFGDALHVMPAQEATRIYHEKYLPSLGFGGMDLEKELTSPVRIQFNSLNLRGEEQWILGRLLTSVPSLNDGAVENQLRKTLAILGCYQVGSGGLELGWKQLQQDSDCQRSLKPKALEYVLQHGEPGLLELMKQRSRWVRSVLDYRRNLAGRTDLESLLDEGFPSFLDKGTKQEFARSLRNPKTQASEWLKWADRLDPLEWNFTRVLHEKRRASTQDARLDMKVNYGQSNAWKMGGREVYYLKDELGWSIFGNLFLKFRQSMILGELSLRDEDITVLSYIGLNLDIETPNYASTATNSGTYTISNRYYPLDFEPWHYFMGLRPQPDGTFILLIQQSRLKELYLRVLQTARQARTTAKAKKLFLEGLDFGSFQVRPRWTESDLLEAWQELFQLARSVDSEKRLASEEFSLLGSGFGFLRYLLGMQARNPLKFWQALNWQRAFHFDLVEIEDMRGLRGEVDSRALSELHLQPNMESKPFKRLMDMVEQGQFGSVDYRYTHGDQGWLVRAVRSRVFPSRLLFMKLPESLVMREIFWIRVVFLAVVLFSILLALLLRGVLLQRVLPPVQRLNDAVQTYQPGDTVRRIHLGLNDEFDTVAQGLSDISQGIHQRMVETEALQVLNDKLLSGESLSALLVEATHRIRTILDAETAVLTIFEAESREKTMASEASLRPGMNRGSWFEEVLQTALALSARDETAKIEFQVRQSKAQRFWFHPINVWKNRLHVRGYLVVGTASSTRDVKPFGPFLSTYLSQAVTVVSKALLEQVREENIQGRDVQISLMPSRSPDVSGLSLASHFEAARYLGGDFFDYLYSSENPQKLGVVISDVSGKGIGPSLFGATVKSFLRTLNDFEKPSGEVLEQTNRGACEGKSNTLFATVFLALIDATTGEMDYASAGHNKMFLFRHASAELEELNSKGLPIGMFDGGAYATQRTTLESGDWLVLYTDGVNELENRHLELYGWKRFTDFLRANLSESSPEAMIEKLKQELKVFRGDHAPSDDITCIMLRYEPS